MRRLLAVLVASTLAYLFLTHPVAHGLWLMPDDSVQHRWISQADYLAGRLGGPGRFLVAAGGTPWWRSFTSTIFFSEETTEDPVDGHSITHHLYATSKRPHAKRWSGSIPNHHSVTFDAHAIGGSSGASSSLTFSHTMTSNGNRYLAVTVTADGAQANAISYNGVSFFSGSVAKKPNFVYTEMFELVAPATGANNVVVGFGSTTDVVAASQSAYGVDQATPRSNTASDENSGSTSASITVAGAVGEVALTAFATFGDATFTFDSGGGGWTQDDVGTDSGVADRVSTGHHTGAASLTRTDTVSPSRQWATIGISLKAAAASGGGCKRSLLGVGC